MRRVRSTLKSAGVPILVAAGVNVFLVLCLCVLLTNHLTPRFGYTVQPQESHFTIASYDRNHTHIVSVAPGETPRLYVGANLVKDGFEGFEAQLASWNSSNPSHVSVVLVIDKAVPAGVVHRLTDMILSHGFTCSYAGVPALE